MKTFTFALTLMIFCLSVSSCLLERGDNGQHQACEGSSADSGCCSSVCSPFHLCCTTGFIVQKVQNLPDIFQNKARLNALYDEDSWNSMFFNRLIKPPI
ncbi:MAG: hypothetical protein LBD45_01425 [Bacteroidales bacterium]|jgi:hypothetical protein|nr:hypothetical protein [Bacteroidales bacterium]